MRREVAQSWELLVLAALLLLLLACGGTNYNQRASIVQPAAPAAPSRTSGTLLSKHIVVVGLENRSYEEVVGSASAPYFNSLFSGSNPRGAVATQYYSDRHSSLCAIMRYVAGQDVSIDPSTGKCNNETLACFKVNNVVHEMLRAHPKWTWTSAQESLPFPGFPGLYAVSYVRRHNPLDYFYPDTCHSPQDMPYWLFLANLRLAPLPNFTYVTPNNMENGHSGSVAEMDLWLKANLPKILAQPAFQSGGDGLMFLVFDEGQLSTDNRCSASKTSGCGGRVATVVIGPQVRKGYRSTHWYNHESLLRTMCGAMQLLGCPGAAAGAQPMEDMFLQPLR